MVFLQMVEKDAIIFEDDVFKIEPPEGDVWPNSTFEVNVVFKPNEAIFHSRTVFCDVSGRQCRLPLKICGDGIGPRVNIFLPFLPLILLFAFTE